MIDSTFRILKSRKEYRHKLTHCFRFERRERAMKDDLVEIENELRSVLQEKHRIQEHIRAIDQDMSLAETLLMMDNHDTVDYQETLEEMIELQDYAAELHAQAVFFEEIALELMLERELWRNPVLLLV
jgi:hypothetical protein